MSTYTAASPDISALSDGQTNLSSSVKTPIANLKTAIETLGNLVTPMAQPPGGRATLTSGTAVTTADVTAATSIYYTPYINDCIQIYDGTNWIPYTFAETTLSLSGLAANTMHDAFGYISGGTLTLEAVAWTNDTTRATSIVRQNGRWCKSGTLTKRLLFSFRTASANQTEDSISKRFLSNTYNAVPRVLRVRDTTDSWTYATAAYRPWNNSTTNRVEFVRGLNETPVNFEVVGTFGQAGSVAGAVGVGLGSTTVNSANIMTYGIPSFAYIGIAKYKDTPALGYNYLQMLEYASGATVTFYGDLGVTYVQTGGMGEVWG